MLKVIKYKCFKIRILQPRCQPKHLLAPVAVLNTLSKTVVFTHQKPKYQCQNCKRQFIKKPTNKVISKDTIELIDRLLYELIPLAGIARAALVSETWLQKYVNNKYTQIPQEIKVSEKPKGKLTIECDEAWSFVASKNNKKWIWLALDKKTREIVGVYIGDAYGGKLRSEDGARGLWNSLPPVYRQCAECSTDFWAA
ncbi:IS1 family transposase [Nostoc flagelliforme]|nr:IS1 family transposase [Nostoc flagelliforme]